MHVLVLNMMRSLAPPFMHVPLRDANSHPELHECGVLRVKLLNVIECVGYAM